MGEASPFGIVTSQFEGTQATLTDLFNEEAKIGVSNTDNVGEVTNYLQFRVVQDNLPDNPSSTT